MNKLAFGGLGVVLGIFLLASTDNPTDYQAQSWDPPAADFTTSPLATPRTTRTALPRRPFVAATRHAMPTATLKSPSENEIPEVHEGRLEVWHDLVAFRDDAGLDEATWRRFLGDLKAIATERGLYDPTGFRPGLLTDLAEDLEEHLGYLDDAAWRELRARFLHPEILPVRIASANVLE